MKRDLSLFELCELQKYCLKKLDSSKLYNLRNIAKIRSVKNARNYDEFKNIVDAAHLKPIVKS